MTASSKVAPLFSNNAPCRASPGMPEFSPCVVLSPHHHQPHPAHPRSSLVAQLASAMGWAFLVKTYVVPYLIVNFWLVTITLLQHTHPGARAARRLRSPFRAPSGPPAAAL